MLRPMLLLLLGHGLLGEPQPATRLNLLAQLTQRRGQGLLGRGAAQEQRGASLLTRIRPTSGPSHRAPTQGPERLLDQLAPTPKPSRVRSSLLDRARSRPRTPYVPSRPTRAPFTPSRTVSRPRHSSGRLISNNLAATRQEQARNSLR